MKKANAFGIFSCALWMLTCGGSRASDQELVDRYYTLAYPADRLVLQPNETAIIDGTLGFGWPYNWVHALYKQGANDFVDLEVPLRIGVQTSWEVGGDDIDWTMPLPGPGLVMLNTNDVFTYGALYTGAIGLRIVRTVPGKRPTDVVPTQPTEFGRYYTLAEPTDRVKLRANETAIIVGTVHRNCEYCSWMNILYRKAGDDFINMLLPSEFTGGTMPLSGPGVVMLNTNDVDFYGALYTSALQLKVIHTKNQGLAEERYCTLAYPRDRLVLEANEAAIIDGTVGYDWPYTYINILYQRGTNNFTNLILPLGVTGGTVPLSGPGVVMLNTNDVYVFGAAYTGAVGFRVVRTSDRNESR